jgi:methylglutamate dehydrogenase subunit D
MLDSHSPLGANAHFENAGIILLEVTGFTLTQVAGEEKLLKKALGKIPAKVGVTLEHEGRRLFRIAPKQLWALGAAPMEIAGIYPTSLSSSRTCIVLQGAKARRLMASCAAIDFSSAAFRPGQFAMTGIHHTPVTIDCVGENEFHVYALRTFALNVWEWLCDLAKGLDHA